MVAAIVADMEENKVANMEVATISKEVTTITIEIATITEEVATITNEQATITKEVTTIANIVIYFNLISNRANNSDEYRVIMTLYSILSHWL